MRSILLRLDRRIGRFLHPPLKFICGVSGFDNFLVARLVLIISTLPSTGFGVYNFLSLTFLGELYLLPIVVLYAGLIYRGFQLEKDVERLDESYENGKPILTQNLMLNLTLRPVVLCMGLATPFILDPPFGISVSVSVLLQQIALYFTTDMQAPRRSLYRRVREWLKAHPIRLPSLTPSPTPRPA